MTGGAANEFIHKALNFLLPPRCALCDETVTRAYALCRECWPKLRFITSPKCSVCGVPLAEVDRDMPCKICAELPPVYTAAQAPLVYNDALKKLILRFKNYDGLNYAPMFVNWLGQCVPEGMDVIVPVPLHWRRFFIRQYNQAAELAKLISENAKIPWEPNILIRRRATASQGYKRREERYANLKGAFVARDFKGKLVNSRALLVDDVLTSGATANACAEALKKAGAAEVRVLTIARVVRAHDFRQERHRSIG